MNHQNPFPRNDLTLWLALIRAPHYGAALGLKLLQYFENPGHIFNAGLKAWQSLDLKDDLIAYLQDPDWTSVESDLRWQEQSNHHVMTYHDTDYPARLRELSNPPMVLFIMGDQQVLRTPQLAMVGSRNPTHVGLENAHQFAYHLAMHGLTITSGLALGIDGAAHQGALSANGRTIAVLGTGIDRIYPMRHRDLATQIAETGAVISEFPPGSPAQAKHFPIRNRIISGLSLGTLVVEASMKSGSLITAYAALEQNREVFAIPGSIHNPLARGCHALLRKGAKLVETVSDILEELPPLMMAESPVAQNMPNLAATPVCTNDEQRRILQCLEDSPISLDQLILRSQLPSAAVARGLLELELHDLVSSHAYGYARGRRSG